MEQKLHLLKHFFEHPDWVHMEDLIITYANSLLSMEDVDTSKPGEDVKAEVIGRLKAYETFCKFISDSKITGRPIIKKNNPFK